MLISTAFAQDAAAAMPQQSIFTAVFPFILVFFVFWLLVWRPQSQKQRQHFEMLENLRRGDRVLTDGGLYGEVTKIVDEATVELKIADDIKIKVAKPYINSVVDKGEPATKPAAKSSKEGGKGKKSSSKSSKK